MSRFRSQPTLAIWRLHATRKISHPLRAIRALVDEVLRDMSREFDGTLIEAWASQKSFQRKDGGTDGDGRQFRGESRSNETHASTTDPDARL